jgi:hypothetical protein
MESNEKTTQTLFAKRVRTPKNLEKRIFYKSFRPPFSKGGAGAGCITPRIAFLFDSFFFALWPQRKSEERFCYIKWRVENAEQRRPFLQKGSAPPKNLK